MDVEKARRNERAGAGRGRGRTFAEQFHVQPALFLRLAQRGLLRVFVQLDVSAERQPFVELAMVDEQNLAVVNDEDRDGEINFFVDVRHVVKEVSNKAFRGEGRILTLTARPINAGLAFVLLRPGWTGARIRLKIVESLELSFLRCIFFKSLWHFLAVIKRMMLVKSDESGW